MELRFDESTHTYMLGDEVLPSVTTLIQPLSGTEYKSIPESVLVKAADRGTAVHAAIESYLKYGIDISDDETRGYVQAFSKWFEKYKPIEIESETRLYHRILHYAGTADMVCTIDGARTVVDFKTTSKLMPRLVCVQLEAYRQALKSHKKDVKGKRVLQLKSDGTWDERIFDENDTTSWKVFNALLTTYRYIHG